MNLTLTPDEVADVLKVPKSTLYAWRQAGRGPRAMRVGRHIRYRVADVEAYLDEQLAADDRNHSARSMRS